MDKKPHPYDSVEKTPLEIFGTLKEFKPTIFVNKIGKTLDIYLEDVPSYHEWIEGKETEVFVIRAQDDNRVVGAVLPLPKNFEYLSIV